jgi:hypothetical protein
MERVALSIGPRELGLSTLVDRSEHVVVGEQVVKTEGLHGRSDAENCLGVTAKFNLRIDGTDFHGQETLQPS